MTAKPKEWIAGRHPVEEALEAGLDLEAIWLAKGAQGPAESRIRAVARERRIPIKVVPPAALHRIWRGNHQGVIAWRAAVAVQHLADIIPAIYERGETPLLVMLDGVTDVRNAGAIARSALATGAHALITGTRDTARLNQEAVKASAGALLHLPVCREPLPAAISLLQQSGIRLIGAALQESQYPWEIDWSGPTCLVLGDEGAGISKNLMIQLDARVRIPQTEQVDSFNVSVAAGILLYEAMKGRMVKG